MEYIDGGSLDDYINERGRLDAYETIKIAKQIGEALSFMHSKQMLHLDLKPGNVMIRDNGQPVLIDFGLSKQYDENGNVVLTGNERCKQVCFFAWEKLDCVENIKEMFGI